MSVIPKEKLEAYQRWQIDSFDAPAEEAPAQPAVADATAGHTGDDGGELVANVQFPTAEDIERLHTEAQEEGYRIGHDAGHAEGYAAGLAEAQQQVEQMAALMDNLRKAMVSMDQEVADAVLELAMETARQIVRSSIAAQPELLLPVIREAIAALPLHHGNISLHMHPDDARFLRDHLGDQLSNNAWHLVDDAEIERGGCYLKAGASEVDATLATRWQRVLESIGTPQDEPAAEHHRRA